MIKRCSRSLFLPITIISYPKCILFFKKNWNIFIKAKIGKNRPLAPHRGATSGPPEWFFWSLLVSINLYWPQGQHKRAKKAKIILSHFSYIAVSCSEPQLTVTGSYKVYLNTQKFLAFFVWKLRLEEFKWTNNIFGRVAKMTDLISIFPHSVSVDMIHLDY